MAEGWLSIGSGADSPAVDARAEGRSVWLAAIARRARERADAIAVSEIDLAGEARRVATWRELELLAGRCALQIRARVKPGGTVLLGIPSGIDLVAWFIASLACGMRLAMMHHRSGPAEFAAVASRCGAVAVVAEAALRGRVDPALAVLDADLGSAVVGGPGLCERASKGPVGRGPGCETRGEIVLGSSGTTGLPKLVIRGASSLDADAMNVCRGLRLTAADRVLCVPPLCHSYGVDLLLGTFLAGAELRVMGEFDPVGAATQLVEGGVSVLPAVPFVVEALAGAPGSVRSPSLRLVVSAGWSLSERVRAAFLARWGIGVGQLYGATELGTVSVSVPGEDLEGTAGGDPRCVGRPLEGVSFRIGAVGDELRELRPGEEGHLLVRAPSMLSGYVDGQLALVDGHLPTGDLAMLDGQGRAVITGRIKLLIDAGGFKVNPLEVEGVLSRHPGVAECAVVPLAFTDTIQRLRALVVPRDALRPPGEAELRSFLRERLAPTKVPRRFEIVGSLPRTALGKLRRDLIAKDRLAKDGLASGRPAKGEA